MIVLGIVSLIVFGESSARFIDGFENSDSFTPVLLSFLTNYISALVLGCVIFGPSVGILLGIIFSSLACNATSKKLLRKLTLKAPSKLYDILSKPVFFHGWCSKQYS